MDFLIHDDGSKGYLYRGQASAEWGLCPSAWRPSVLDKLRARVKARMGDAWVDEMLLPGVQGAERLAERYCEDSGAESIARLRDLFVWLAAEREVVNAFAFCCDRVALPLPEIDASRIVSRIFEARAIVGSHVQESSKRRTREIPIFEPTVVYALAQHLGLPTRLLDFSDSPLKAAYFAACGNFPLINYLGNPDRNIAIWALRGPDKDSLLASMMHGDMTSPFRVLRSQIPFLHAQDGLFLTCNASSNLHYLLTGNWPDFLDVMHGWSAEIWTLPASESTEVRRILGRLGIDEVTMMPSFEKAVACVLRSIVRSS